MAEVFDDHPECLTNLHRPCHRKCAGKRSCKDRSNDNGRKCPFLRAIANVQANVSQTNLHRTLPSQMCRQKVLHVRLVTYHRKCAGKRMEGIFVRFDVKAQLKNVSLRLYGYHRLHQFKSSFWQWRTNGGNSCTLVAMCAVSLLSQQNFPNGVQAQDQS